MAAINTEHDTQDRIIRGQKTALDSIVVDLSSLRLMGKDKESTTSHIGTPAATPVPDGTEADDALPVTRDSSQVDEGMVEDEEKETGEVAEEKEDGEDDESDDIPLSNFNSAAKEFPPGSHTPSSLHLQPQEEDDDIEMGEVAEDPKVKGKKAREELEEGEASDASSALSDPPDD
jgi:THO complex subunit 7